MNKKNLSSVTIELTKLIDIFKISGHGHVIDRLGFKEVDSQDNQYIELSKLIEKLIKTNQEEMINKLCLDNECWTKVNSLSIHNFLNILQAEKLSKMLEMTQEEIKKTTPLNKSSNNQIQALNEQDKLRLKNTINSQVQNTNQLKKPINKLTTLPVLSMPIPIVPQMKKISEKEIVKFQEENEINHINEFTNLENNTHSKMAVSTGLNSKIYTSSSKSRHMPSVPHVSTENMLSNYIFSGSSTKMNESDVSEISLNVLSSKSSTININNNKKKKENLN